MHCKSNICRTIQTENRVADYCNAVLVRSEAESNRCTRFCRPLPNRSAIRPFDGFVPALLNVVCCRLLSSPPLQQLLENTRQQVVYKPFGECKYTHNSDKSKKIDNKTYACSESGCWFVRFCCGRSSSLTRIKTRR